LKTLYNCVSFHRIPDSAAEPDLEIHPTTDPVVIPLEDVTGNPDSVNDFQNTPWPEPKPIIIPQSPPPQFQQAPPPSFTPFPNHQNHPNQTFSGPQQMFPNQTGMANNVSTPGGMLMPNPMNSMHPVGGDWRVSIKWT
jgi:protein phosphatase 1 regulatory subunit 10